ncbi:MAG TPA: S8 family peptidase, partial [Saprospiraceae bacterium]|nr:S8 family peptidase [Saprospiraceae bacterium]
CDSVAAQYPFQNKCSPALILGETDTIRQPFTLVVENAAVFREWAAAQKLEVLGGFPPANIVVLRVSSQDLATKILQRPDVLFADHSNTVPKEELPVPGHNLFVNKINVAHAMFPGFNGSGITVSVKENRFDTADVDLKKRAMYAFNAAQQGTSHAAIMASLVGGAGTSDPAGQGVAEGVRLISNGFNNLLPEADYQALSVTVQNHSYGLDIENYYGAGALAYDVSVEENPTLAHVFSAGNKGLEASTTGTYANVPGFANLTGNFKMAKNILTVGAVDSFGQIAPFSSHGPAYDGRVKPDLVAFGQDGSSGSAALVSGAGAVLQQAFFAKTDSLPLASLVRAVLLNSADDIDPPGPDYFSGFGNLNFKRALQVVESQYFETGEAGENEMLFFPLDLPPDAAQLKIMLAWDDPAANANASKALVNDLDLKVISPDGTEWLPWVLNIAPHPDSLRLPAVRHRDTLNNVEQVTLDYPPAGQYVVQVSGSYIRTTIQSFSLTWNWERANAFIWDCPVKNDPAVAGQDVLLRWESTLTDTAGVLEYRFSGSTEWQIIDPAIDLRKLWHRWPVPDTFAEAQVRMRIGSQAFESDTFLISTDLRMKIGFNCPDSVLLFWNRAAPAASYLVSGLGEKYLEPLQVLTDTFVILQKSGFPQIRFSVTPVGAGGVAGLQSPSPDIGTQGLACYFASFLAGLNADFQTELRLSIGTRYGVQSVSFEKINDGAFAALQTWQPVDSEEFMFTDEQPQPGVNHYRARLDLLNGATLYSDTLAVYLLAQNELLVFPNPAFRNSISVAANISDEASFVLFDVLGRLILEETLGNLPQEIILPAGLPKGSYPFFLRENGHLTSGGILMVGF